MCAYTRLCGRKYRVRYHESIITHKLDVTLLFTLSHPHTHIYVHVNDFLYTKILLTKLTDNCHYVSHICTASYFFTIPIPNEVQYHSDLRCVF